MKRLATLLVATAAGWFLLLQLPSGQALLLPFTSQKNCTLQGEFFTQPTVDTKATGPETSPYYIPGSSVSVCWSS